MQRSKPLAMMLVALVLTGAGCYTVLRHPPTYDLADGHDDSYQQKACADCHADADLYHYTAGHGSGWYEYYPAPWAVYYQSPWWYEDFWYYTPDPGRPGSRPVTGERTPWSRSIGTDPGPLPSQGGEKIGKAPAPGTPRSDPKESEEKPEPPKKKKRTIWGR